MKKLLMFISLMALPLAFISCDGEETPAAPIGKMLTPPTYHSNAEMYFDISLLDPKNIEPLEQLAPQIVVKLGEDGKAWVFSRERKLVEQSVACQKPYHDYTLMATLAAGLPEKWFVFTTSYTQPKAQQFKIKGWATLMTMGAQEKVKMSIVREGKVPLEVVAQKVKSPIKSSELTQKFARTWKIAQTKIEVSGGDLQNTYGKVFKGEKASDLTEIAADLDNLDSGLKANMGKYLKEHNRSTRIETVTLSQTGVLSIAYANGQNDLARIDQYVEGQRFSPVWLGKQLNNEYLTGDNGVTLEVQNNYLLLSLNSSVKAQGVSAPYNVKVAFVLEWAE